MDYYAMLTAWILSGIGLLSCQGQQLLDGPYEKAVGEKVLFTLINPPSSPPFSITWSHEKTTIINLVGSGNETHHAYKDRISVDKSTVSLELRDLTVSDSGEYTLTISTDGVPTTGNTSLEVFERIANVAAKANQTQLVEFNSSVILTCSASGSSPSFQWCKGNAAVTGSDRVHLSSDNISLTILNVNRNDNGPYQCKVSNRINTEMSPTVSLTIYSGPDSAELKVEPEEPLYSSGSDITFSCSSESNPEAQFQWALNGNLLDSKEAKLRLKNVQTSQSGAYSCWAYNSETQRYNLSSPTTINVIEKVSGVVITSSGGTLIAGESSVKLTCDGQGFIMTRNWTRDGKPLYPSNRTSFLEKNRVLSISPVEAEDNGQYTCTVSNPVSTGFYHYKLVVKPSGYSEGLSDLAIAFIVIAVLIALAIPVVIFALKKNGIRCPSKSQEEPTNNDSAELNYADISHFQRKNVQRVDQGNGGNGETLYSGVRLPSSQAGPTSGQGPTHFQNNAVGMKANSRNVGDAVRPKGQAPGPPSHVPDVTYAQVKK